MNHRRVTNDELETIRKMLADGASYKAIGLATNRSAPAARNLAWRYHLGLEHAPQAEPEQYREPSPPRRFSWEMAA